MLVLVNGSRLLEAGQQVRKEVSDVLNDIQTTLNGDHGRGKVSQAIRGAIVRLPM